jgi:hypothetical protein
LKPTSQKLRRLPELGKSLMVMQLDRDPLDGLKQMAMLVMPYDLGD